MNQKTADIHPSWSVYKKGCRCANCLKLKHDANVRYKLKRKAMRPVVPRKQRKDATTVNTFLSKLIFNQHTGCLEFNGTRDRQGYGRISYQGKMWLTHRLAYFFRNGAIPNGMVICHKCDNPSCCNHDHLFIGTISDNSRDMIKKNRHPKLKLRNEDVILILKELESGNKPLKDIGKEYDVPSSTISKIKLNKTWKHIPRFQLAS